jgi:predicted PurR-regulated permease PerM
MEPPKPTLEHTEPVLIPGEPVRGTPPSDVRLARISFGVLLGLATLLLAYLASPFAAPLFLAAVLATLLHGPFEWLTGRMRGRRRLAAALITLAVFIVLVAPFASLVGFAAREAAVGLAYLRDTLGVHSVGQLQSGHLPPRAEALLQHLLAMAHLSRAQLGEYAGRFSGRAEQLGTAAVAASSHLVVHMIIMLAAFFFLIIEGRDLVRLLTRVSPLEARQTRELLAEFRNVSSAAVLGTLVTAGFQGAMTGIGFAVAGVPHPLFFALLALLASFIPVIGTALVWVPAVALLGLSGHPGWASALAGWCLVVVVGAEHALKPLVMRGRVEMSTGLLLLALLGGLEMFGLLGVLLGPLIVAFFLALLRMYERDFLARQRPIH